jgi:quercetin dioxygenase-like cupin family protein
MTKTVEGDHAMSDTVSKEHAAHLVEPRDIEAFNVLGPVVEYMTRPEDGAPCVMRGTIPPRISVPLHSHADPETFYMISGEIEGLSHSPASLEWVRIKPGDIFHVPGGAKHAFRNRAQAPAVMIIVSTDKIGHFFREVGIPLVPEMQPPGPPTNETIRHFLETSERYGYWNASPEENAQIGLMLPPV